MGKEVKGKSILQKAISRTENVCVFVCERERINSRSSSRRLGALRNDVGISEQTVERRARECAIIISQKNDREK